MEAQNNDKASIFSISEINLIKWTAHVRNQNDL